MLKYVNNTQRLIVVGAGLAGSEAAWQAARRGVRVLLYEMRPHRMTEAHKTAGCAELVCSNSFRSDDVETSAVGLLHEELRRAGSLIMEAADFHKLPAGGALAVDRDSFSAEITARLEGHPLIEIRRGEITALPQEGDGPAVIATGPLTSPELAANICRVTCEDALSFFDAIAPIVLRDTVDVRIAFLQSRYDKAGPGGDGADYINCPLDEAQYNAFIDALLAAEKTAFKDFETTPYFEGCLPIEVMAERGRQTLRFGPMKPVGLTDPRTGKRPYAVVQLRQDNALGTLWNMVGFQTKLRHGEQTRVFRMIPGLEKAVFARLGGLHRNTFLNSPKLLDAQLRLKARPNVRFAGQITGVEGYVESTAIGLVAGTMAAIEMQGGAAPPPPATTALGALVNHITGGHLSVPQDAAHNAAASFQPMNVNFGLFPPLAPGDEPGGKKKAAERGLARKKALAARALRDLQGWLDALGTCVLRPKAASSPPSSR